MSKPEPTANKNPILVVMNAGYGETPIPKDALCAIGSELNIHDANTGEQELAKVIAIAPATVPPEYALADQANPKQPRPLIMEFQPQAQTSYVIQRQHQKVLVLQNRMAKGLQAAKDAEL